MANMFKCALAGGGDGASLIVTCTPNFAGSTITLTNGTKTYTQVCPLTSPYKVTFESIATGIWTVSGIAQSQTFSTSVTITDFEALLADIPEGSTVTPTDDIQIWLHSANIWDKAYTTITQVLNDASTLQALIASNNAADYMARSTTWASDVKADSSAMSYIGLNNYCADALLSNSTWLTSICNSTYFESVLNVKVPTMTSNTTPSGSCFAYPSTDATAYRAFDGDDSTWSETSRVESRGSGYMFTENVAVYKVYLLYSTSSAGNADYSIQCSNDGNTWNNVMNFSDTLDIDESVILNSVQYYKYWRAIKQTSSTGIALFHTLQFYGRASS